MAKKNKTPTKPFYGFSRVLLGKDDYLLKTNCVCFFVLSSLSSLSAKVTFAESYRDKNNDYYFSAKGAIPKKR